MDNIKLIENLTAVKAKIKESCIKAKRDPQEVEIVAASKSRDIATIKALDALGIKVFGENRVQEFVSKYDPVLQWDIIGQLQRNKVKYIIDKVRLIHSVDRLSLAAEIDRQAKKNSKVQDILMQINTGAEESKGGIVVCEGVAFAESLEVYNNIRLVGVMAVTPIEVGDKERRELFLSVKKLYDTLKEKYPTIKYLSMGMTDDYPLAVRCGSNLVRLGRVLFD
ncbi:MAG: YggS family pyridoxal phosphate-dependent enzyme [Clostridia bacterium]